MLLLFDFEALSFKINLYYSEYTKHIRFISFIKK